MKYIFVHGLVWFVCYLLKFDKGHQYFINRIFSVLL